MDRVYMDQMDLRTLIRFGRSCQELNSRVESYMGHTFTVSRYLEPVLLPSEHSSFRHLQYDTGLVISGSTVLHFISRDTSWRPANLDLYVELRRASPVIAWLLSAGFIYLSRPFDDDYETAQSALNKAQHILNYNKERPGRDNCRGVQLAFWRNCHFITLYATTHSVMEAILTFHSTGIMNMITHDKVYSLYPNATFGHQLFLLQPGFDFKRIPWIMMKYHAIGYSFACSLPQNTPAQFHAYTYRTSDVKNALRVSYHDETLGKAIRIKVNLDPQSGSVFRSGMRRVGDSQCWVFKLPSLSVAEQDQLIEGNTWSLSTDKLGCLHLSWNRLEYLELGGFYTSVEVPLFISLLETILRTCDTDSALDNCLLNNVKGLLTDDEVISAANKHPVLSALWDGLHIDG
ncbi:hypothetical protein JR316_0004011 [Psilocybe cubensis]|uniref:Uncharacterized protein n=2 Tax=Psilocybe cubensis TaxID=181762 RepID=A0A8H7Y6A5_PSICU|nr:hypothetical protein JR316_0004011 [Psilocybe cubensis]KAH9484529.1 hypothetical protein JR316_0004011 [Psilocybe cubensis]